MTDKTPLLTDKEIDQIHFEEWSDGGGYRIVLRVARRVETLVAERAAAAEREGLIEKAESSLNSLDETCSWAAAGYAQGIRDFVDAIRARGAK